MHLSDTYQGKTRYAWNDEKYFNKIYKVVENTTRNSFILETLNYLLANYTKNTLICMGIVGGMPSEPNG